MNAIADFTNILVVLNAKKDWIASNSIKEII